MNVKDSKVFTDEREAGGIEARVQRKLRALRRETETLEFENQMNALRLLFWERLTKDSTHNDRRRKDYNQALFGHWDDESPEDEKSWFQYFRQMTPQMIMEKYDEAVSDWKRWRAKNGK